MCNRTVIVALVLLVLIGSVFGTSAFAQNPGRGTTLVCYAGGGDGFSLVEWTPEQVADYEAKTGRDVAELAVHPETGDCFDFASLMSGWVPSLPWLCLPDTEGRWSGPNWVYPWTPKRNAMPPDPATGRCPQPWSPIVGSGTELERAAATAVHMTELEVAADYDRLYAWMHPDSKAIVPQSAMEGWYREVFAKRTPTWMTVNDARLVEWTWEVTGKVYPSAAEVPFRQRFVDGEETDGVAWLVRDNGVWRWFFGRDHALVEEQIARFSGEQPDISQGSSPSLATIPAAGTIERAPYIIFDLGTGNGNWSAAYDINERGDILWTWATSQDPMSDRFFDSHRMLWANGTSTDLSDRGIEFTRSINDGGTVLGGAHVEGASRSHLLYQTDSGTVTPIDPFDGGAVLDINDAGDLLGFIDGTAAIAVQGTVETVPIPQGFTQLQPVAINESGHVAARAAVNPIGDTNQRAALFEDGIVTVLEPAPGALSSSADDLNDLGQLVGSPGIRGSRVIHQNGRAFLHDSGIGRTTDLGTLPGYQNSVATAINNVGQVVGYAWLPENEGESIRRAYLYDYRIGVMTDLNQRIPPGSGWFLTDAFDINDAGQIVGRGLVGGEMHAFLLTPTGDSVLGPARTLRSMPQLSSVVVILAVCAKPSSASGLRGHPTWETKAAAASRWH